MKKNTTQTMKNLTKKYYGKLIDVMLNNCIIRGEYYETLSDTKAVFRYCDNGKLVFRIIQINQIAMPAGAHPARQQENQWKNK